MPKIKRSQAGFTLIEVSIALAITAAVSIYALYPKIQELRLRKADSQAVQAMVVSNAVATLMTRNYGNLVAGTSVAGLADPYAPTIAELNNLGLLTNFADKNLYGGGYAIVITREPAGCTPPNCDLASWTYLTTPVTNPLTGRVDGDALGRAATSIGTNAGFSRTDAPATINGGTGTWSRPNPLGNTAGILMIRAGYGSSGLAQFMRRDGTLPATGTQDMGGQDVKNVATLRSTTIANSGGATIGGALGVTGGTTTNGISNTGALSTTTATVTGALQAGTANVTGAVTAGSATVTGALQAGTANVTGAVTAGSATVNGATNLNGTTTVASTLAVTGATTLNSSLAVTGATIANGITNNGLLTNTGDIKAPRVYLTTIVPANGACAGFNGYQATTSTGQIASCVNGVWQAYTPAPPPSPCNSTTVSWQGCQGTVPYTQSGNTANVSVTSGSGAATYSCQNGSWAFQSGSCTPPPAGCSAQYVYWSGSASCSGYASAMSSGGGQWVSSSGSGSGSAYATCSNGSISLSSASCSNPTRTFYNPTAADGTALSSNPANRTTFCQANGYADAYGAGSQSDYGGNNLAVCWSIDGSLRCTGGGNCTGFTYGNPGCWVQTAVTCQ